VGIVSAGRLSRGRPPALETGQSTTPTAKTRRQVRQRQRHRHGSKLVLRFHQGRWALTQSTVPQVGQATSNAVSRAKERGWRPDIAVREATEYASDVCMSDSVHRRVSLAMPFDGRELSVNAIAPNSGNHDLRRSCTTRGVLSGLPRRAGTDSILANLSACQLCKVGNLLAPSPAGGDGTAA
jgi:hypothetical protein